MKTTIKTLAILMMAAGLTACGDDDNTENAGLKEYALQVKVSLAPNDSTVVEQLHRTVETALSSIGMSKDNPYLYLAARDSADAAPKVQEIGKKLEAVLDKYASQMYGNAYIFAIEKEQLDIDDSKQSSWSCWYEANYPEPDNDWTYWIKSEHFFVYNLRIATDDSFISFPPDCKKFNENDKDGFCYRYVDITDLNDGARGLYLYLIFTGVSQATHPVYGQQLITDVVMLNTGGDSNYPEYVDLPNWADGKTRRYYPVFAEDKGANGSKKHDLNCKAGGPYLWMYYTTDYRDGYVLANKTNKISGEVMKTLVQQIKNGSEMPERYYMHAFKKNAAGEWIDYGTANMNEGTRGDDVFLSLAFRKIK